MGGCVRITAHDGHSGQRQAFLRANHVDDSVIGRTHTEALYPKFAAVLLQSLHLLAAYRILYALLLVRWGIMVGHCKHLVGAQHAASLVTYGVKRLRSGNLVAVQTVYVKHIGAIGNRLDHMCIPNLVK